MELSNTAPNDKMTSSDVIHYTLHTTLSIHNTTQGKCGHHNIKHAITDRVHHTLCNSRLYSATQEKVMYRSGVFGVYHHCRKDYIHACTPVWYIDPTPVYKNQNSN
jgi:hypothetical protein